MTTAPPATPEPSAIGRRLGFVVDQRRCIGCHACVVACVAENQDPLGVFRTWVSVVEAGAFPTSTLRWRLNHCHHCDAAPCVAICPTRALFKRPDGAVDFDPRRCVGCRACVEACPFDAITFNPIGQTIAKCHLCSHRLDVGLAPACVPACPTQAIHFGDFADPASVVSRLALESDAERPRAELKVGSNLWFVDGDPGPLDPLVSSVETAWAWAERPPTAPIWEPSLPPARVTAGEPPAAATSKLIYAATPAPGWGEAVAVASWFRQLACGVVAAAALMVLIGGVRPDLSGEGEALMFGWAPPLVAIAGLIVAAGLALGDWQKPFRVRLLFWRPNLRAWLVWSAWSQFLGLAAAVGWLVVVQQERNLAEIAVGAAVVALVVALASAGVWRQATGRDLWGNPWALPRALAQTMLAGAATLEVIGIVVVVDVDTQWRLAIMLGLTLVGLALVSVAAFTSGYRGRPGVAAARQILLGIFRDRFWGGIVAFSLLLPLLMVVVALTDAAAPRQDGTISALLVVAPPIAAILALVGLWHDHIVWLRAGQYAPRG